MQLPPPQLTEALNFCPDLRDPLREHLSTFTEAQRAHIPAAIQEIVLSSYPVTSPVGIAPSTLPTPMTQPPPSVPPSNELVRYLYSLSFITMKQIELNLIFVKAMGCNICKLPILNTCESSIILH